MRSPKVISGSTDTSHTLPATPWDEAVAQALLQRAKAGDAHAADALAAMLLPLCALAVATYARRHPADWHRAEDREDAAAVAAARAYRWAVERYNPAHTGATPLHAAARAITYQRASNLARARRTRRREILTDAVPDTPAPAAQNPAAAREPTPTARAIAALTTADPPAAAVARALASGCRPTARALATATGLTHAAALAAAYRARAAIAAALAAEQGQSVRKTAHHLGNELHKTGKDG